MLKEGRAMCFRKLLNWEGFLHFNLALLRALPMQCKGMRSNPCILSNMILGQLRTKHEREWIMKWDQKHRVYILLKF